MFLRLGRVGGLLVVLVAASIVDAGRSGAARGPNVVTVDFDGRPAPCFFAHASPLRAVGGLVFDGPGEVLDDCSNFGVTGHSPPNFLAFSCPAGVAPPETISFPRGAVNVSLGVAGGETPDTVVFTATRGHSTTTQTVTAGMAVVTVSFHGAVQTLTIAVPDPSGDFCSFVVDDLTYMAPPR